MDQICAALVEFDLDSTFCCATIKIAYTELRVSASTESTRLAGAVAHILREGKAARIRGIGAGAINQGTKATAIARQYLVDDNLDLVVVPEMVTTRLGNDQRTAVDLYVYPVNLTGRGGAPFFAALQNDDSQLVSVT